MGDIKRILLTADVATPPLNRRLVIELCENVHIHYRNLRIEMPKQEFLMIMAAVKAIDENAVREFKYGPSAFKAIPEMILSEQTPFDRRLQVEEQRDGTIHIHYRNMRLEV